LNSGTLALSQRLKVKPKAAHCEVLHVAMGWALHMRLMQPSSGFFQADHGNSSLKML